MKKIVILLAALAGMSGCGPRPDADGWYSIFDGKSLDGWKASEHTATFTVEDGSIVAHGDRSHLFYAGEVKDAVFKNFEFSADVMTKPGANSGIYFHTEFQPEGWPARGFEVQINNSFIGDPKNPETRKTGSLYGVRNEYLSFVNDDQWFNMHIVVRGNRAQVWIDGKCVVDYLQPADPYRPKGTEGRVINKGTLPCRGTIRTA